jgi:hypothetical protein
LCHQQAPFRKGSADTCFFTPSLASVLFPQRGADFVRVSFALKVPATIPALSVLKNVLVLTALLLPPVGVALDITVEHC